THSSDLPFPKEISSVAVSPATRRYCVLFDASTVHTSFSSSSSPLSSPLPPPLSSLLCISASSSASAVAWALYVMRRKRSFSEVRKASSAQGTRKKTASRQHDCKYIGPAVRNWHTKVRGDDHAPRVVHRHHIHLFRKPLRK